MIQFIKMTLIKLIIKKKIIDIENENVENAIKESLAEEQQRKSLEYKNILYKKNHKKYQSLLENKINNNYSDKNIKTNTSFPSIQVRDVRKMLNNDKKNDEKLYLLNDLNDNNNKNKNWFNKQTKIDYIESKKIYDNLTNFHNNTKTSIITENIMGPPSYNYYHKKKTTIIK